MVRNNWYCVHPLPAIYNMETGEAFYTLGNVWICDKCDIQWIVVPSPYSEGINMWQQPTANTMRTT